MVIPRRAPIRIAPASRALMTACALCLLALAGCTTAAPRDYAASLPRHDPKWQSPECARMRTAAMTYGEGKRPPLSWGAGALLGPYGLALAAAGKDHQEKQRKLFARDMHLACSSQPLPKELDISPGAETESQRGRP
jgi:hypothetical protein